MEDMEHKSLIRYELYASNLDTKFQSRGGEGRGRGGREGRGGVYTVP